MKAYTNAKIFNIRDALVPDYVRTAVRVWYDNNFGGGRMNMFSLTLNDLKNDAEEGDARVIEWFDDQLDGVYTQVFYLDDQDPW